MKPYQIKLLLLIIIASLTACQQGSTTVRDLWVRAAPADRPATAAFATIVNNTDEMETLLSASTKDVERVEIHTMEMTDGVMKMRPVEKLEIPAGKSLSLKPGGHHIMLIGLQKEFKAGETHSITLNLARAGAMEIPFTIKAE